MRDPEILSLSAQRSRRNLLKMGTIVVSGAVMARSTRPTARVFLRAGETVTSLDGTPVCTVRCDIRSGEDVTENEFVGWLNAPDIKQGLDGLPGKRYLRIVKDLGIDIHTDRGWAAETEPPAVFVLN